MKKAIFILASAAMFLAVLSASHGQQQVFAQYPSGGGDTASAGGVSNSTLQKCTNLGIIRSECSDQTILAKERIGAVGQGSGTPMIATQSGQMLVFVGVLGTIFGGVAAAFLVQSRRASGQERKTREQLR